MHAEHVSRLPENKADSTYRAAEMPSTRVHQHRARHRNRSHGIGCESRSVCWKCMPQTSFKFRYVNRSPEIRPKHRTV